MTDTQNFNEIVRMMERGQVTIPINIRKKLKISPQTWLWVKLTEKDKIIIEPLERNGSPNKLANFLKNSAFDNRVYWDEQDSQSLARVKEKSIIRLKKITA